MQRSSFIYRFWLCPETYSLPSPQACYEIPCAAARWDAANPARAVAPVATCNSMRKAELADDEVCKSWPPCSSTMRQQAPSESVEGRFSPSELRTVGTTAGSTDPHARPKDQRRRSPPSQLSTSMSPYEERGLGCAIKMATDLRRKVQADVENLV